MFYTRQKASEGYNGRKYDRQRKKKTHVTNIIIIQIDYLFLLVEQLIIFIHQPRIILIQIFPLV